VVTRARPPAIVDRLTWEAAQNIAAEDGTSRGDDGRSRHPAAVRSYAYRSRIRCRDCHRTNAGPSGVVIALRAGGGRGQQDSRNGHRVP
jgi:hypothetical protein